MKVEGFSVQEASEKVRIAASDYIEETWYDESQCNIGWQSTSLWGLMYAIMIQEWGFKPWTVGHRTNNWGSLHSSLGTRMPVDVHCADGTCKRPEYASIEDWLFEKAHLIANDKYRYKCSFNYNSLYAYVVGPNANPNAMHITGRTNSQHITALFWQMKRNAMQFDWNAITNTNIGSVSQKKWWVSLLEWLPRIDWNTHTRYRTDFTKMDSVQIDTWDWEMIIKVDCPDTGCQIFKWNTK